MVSKFSLSACFGLLAHVLLAYDRSHIFSHNNIDYDTKASPVAHFKAFYRFSQEFAALNFPVFNCFSLRRSWSPCYATIDSKILCQNILDRKWRIGTDNMPLFMRISLFKRRSSTGT
jgi:hypothetical protein